jgi:hypothetical protein
VGRADAASGPSWPGPAADSIPPAAGRGGSIEVIWTSGGLDKLEIYARLGVSEVWFWQDGRLSVHVLRGGIDERVPRSAVFPDLDLQLLCSFMDRPTATQAVRAFREALAR